MIDITALAQTVTALLIPALPALIKVGDGALEKVGADISDKVKLLWAKLRPLLKIKPAAVDAVTDVVNNPKDEDAMAALRLQIKKILNENAELAAEISQVISVNTTTQASVVQQDGGIFVGGSATFSGDVAGRDLHKK